MTYYDSPMVLAHYFIELSPYVTLMDDLHAHTG
jgi:hypothetical protein